MREIKFRQPRLGINGNFIDWFYWGFINGGFIAPLSFSVPNYQYTGLKDKNGKEIYEGDILEHYSPLVPRGVNPRIRLVVKWNQRNLAFENCSHSQEVIGNIYENPELLRKGEDDGHD